MSIFRNFNKTLNAQRLARPNNILLKACYTPVYACTATQPSIDHLNTLKDLQNTVSKIRSLKQDGSFKSIIEEQLTFLNKISDNYRVYARKYTENGGKLTAQGLANLYACADELQINSQWFKTYAYDQIPHQLKYMSLDNLQDLKEGLSKHHPDSEYFSLVSEQINNKMTEPYQYVNYAPHEISQFQDEDHSKSTNILIRNYESGSSLRYYAEKAIQAYWDTVLNMFHKKPYGYILHSQ